VEVLDIRADKINFSKFSDRKLKDFISAWELIPGTRILNSIDTYIAALKESFNRFKDESYWKIEYFREHPEATIQDFEMWFREI
jgi:hypothetical protein